MNNYKEEFESYLKRMAEEPAEGREDLDWLVGAIGKDLRALEGEFIAYMDGFDEQKDPDFELELYEAIYETFY